MFNIWRKSFLFFASAEDESPKNYYIKRLEIGGYNVDLWFDDKAQLKMKSPTFPLISSNGEIFRIIFGNIIVLACDNNGKSVGLSDDFIKFKIKAKTPTS